MHVPIAGGNVNSDTAAGPLETVFVTGAVTDGLLVGIATITALTQVRTDRVSAYQVSTKQLCSRDPSRVAMGLSSCVPEVGRSGNAQRRVTDPA